MQHPRRRGDDLEPDRGKLATFNAFWDRYGRLLMTAATAMGGWIVVNLYDPIKLLPEIQKTHEEIVRDNVILKEDSRDMKDILKILVKMQCIQMDALDRVKINLNCADVPLPDPAALRRLRPSTDIR